MSLTVATSNIMPNDLEFMVLSNKDLPPEFQGYKVRRDCILTNEMLAEHGFNGASAVRFQNAGRITGYMRDFGLTPQMEVSDGSNFVAATVAHLFETPESVSGWMNNIFLKDFQENIGNSIGQGHQLISIKKLEPRGFFDEAVAIKALQGGAGPGGLLSSTVIDFRVGRILGVAYVGSVGDHERFDLARELAMSLEKRIVRVVLGAG